MQNSHFIPKEINIKDYKKGKLISKGGFGRVYKVNEKETGEIYAAKIVDCNDDEEKCNEMVNREIWIMFCAKHPTIIKFIGYSKLDLHEENNVTIIMELAKNGSLETILQKVKSHSAPIDYTNIIRQIILAGVSRAMKYLHDRNIIHRDLKPGNVLLDDYFYPHITDFGMSKIYDTGHSLSQSKFGGTLTYEAPEILKEETYNSKVDVYSFGILMYEVITDLVPYPDFLSGKLSKLDFNKKVIYDNYRPEFSLPIKKSFKNLIEKCWSTNPDERPDFEEIFDKLSNRDKSNEYLISNDIDMKEFNLYIKEITEINDPIEKLLDKLRLIKEEKNKLENEKEKLKADNVKLKSTNEKQLDQIASYKSEYKKLKEVINKPKTENKKQLDQIASYKSENEKLKTENKKQLDQIASYKSENEKLKTENTKHLNQIASYKNESDKLKEYITKLKTTNKKQLDQIASYKSENNKLKEVINKLKTANKKQLDEIASYESEKEKFEEDNEKLKTENKKHLDQIASYKNESDKLKEYIIKLKTKNKKHLNQIVSYKNESDKLKEYITKLKTTNKKQFDQIALYKREIIYASLKHIGILSFDKYDKHQKNTKYILNGNLQELIGHVSRGLSPDDWDTIRSLNIFGIAAAMAYIHQHNIMYKDLKSSNIVLDENYYPKIYFDFSKYIENIEKLLHMAPEPYNNEYYSEKANVYAYSMIIYEALTYKTRYDGNFSGIPYEYKILIEKCFDQDPKKRPSFIQIVKDFMDNKDDYFDQNLIDVYKLENYIEIATKDLDFSTF